MISNVPFNPRRQAMMRKAEAKADAAALAAAAPE
jgi:hypothetical protein